MRYLAQSIDAKLLALFKENPSIFFKLHSRFEHAINFVNETGYMITFLSKGLPSAPRTLIVDAENFNEWKFSDKDQLSYTEQHLLLGDLEIQLDYIVTWQCELPKFKVDNTKIVAECINQFLERHNEPLSKIEEAIYTKLDNNYAKIITAYQAQDYEQLQNSVVETIGLGMGLTPSGDDRLVGFLLGLYTQKNHHQKLVDIIAKAIMESEERTNSISYTMLLEAKEGRFNEWLVGLIEANNSDRPECLRIAMEKIFSIGSRSGGDMLKGFQLSIAII